MKAQVKNWKQFQHYKDRSPPWVKLHKGLLDDFDYSRLPLASKALAPLIWLLASESQDGTFEADPERLAFRIRWDAQEVSAGLSGLINRGFIVCDSEPLAECEQPACLEAEAYKEQKEQKEPKQEQTAQPRKRGTRLPEDWEPSSADHDFVLSARPDLRSDIYTEANKFRDYWHAKAGKDGTKLDWSATWRNWIRNARANARAGPQQPPGKQVQAIHAIQRLRDECRNDERLDSDPNAKADVHRLGGPAVR